MASRLPIFMLFSLLFNGAKDKHKNMLKVELMVMFMVNFIIINMVFKVVEELIVLSRSTAITSRLPIFILVFFICSMGVRTSKRICLMRS